MHLRTVECVFDSRPSKEKAFRKAKNLPQVHWVLCKCRIRYLILGDKYSVCATSGRSVAWSVDWKRYRTFNKIQLRSELVKGRHSNWTKSFHEKTNSGVSLSVVWWQWLIWLDQKSLTLRCHHYWKRSMHILVFSMPLDNCHHFKTHPRLKLYQFIKTQRKKIKINWRHWFFIIQFLQVSGLMYLEISLDQEGSSPFSGLK